MPGAGAGLDERGAALGPQLGKKGVARRLAPQPTAAALRTARGLLVVEGGEVGFEVISVGEQGAGLVGVLNVVGW